MIYINFLINPKSKLLILGVSGSGKTTTGKVLAGHLNFSCLSSQDLIPLIQREMKKYHNKTIEEDYKVAINIMTNYLKKALTNKNTKIIEGVELYYLMNESKYRKLMLKMPCIIMGRSRILGAIKKIAIGKFFNRLQYNFSDMIKVYNEFIKERKSQKNTYIESFNLEEFIRKNFTKEYGKLYNSI